MQAALFKATRLPGKKIIDDNVGIAELCQLLN